MAALSAALACGTPSRESALYLRTVTDAEAPLERAGRRFDAAVAASDWPAARVAAREAAAGAARARDVLERMSVPGALVTARREELLFANHALLAYQEFAARGSTGVDLAKLRSILRRGRTHQARGRETLR